MILVVIFYPNNLLNFEVYQRYLKLFYLKDTFQYLVGISYVLTYFYQVVVKSVKEAILTYQELISLQVNLVIDFAFKLMIQKNRLYTLKE